MSAIATTNRRCEWCERHGATICGDQCAGMVCTRERGHEGGHVACYREKTIEGWRFVHASAGWENTA